MADTDIASGLSMHAVNDEEENEQIFWIVGERDVDAAC